MSISDALIKLDNTIQKHGYSGSVLISFKGKVLFKKSYGFSNRELGTKNEINSVYRIASITKQFTAAGILKLVESGKISLNDPVSKVIIDYPNGNSIQIHHLLSNSSGIQGFSLDTDFHDVLRSNNVNLELIHLFQSLPLSFKPGSKFEYSISGYLLLGYIIEIISKMSYIDFLKKNFFEPFEMNNTDFDDYQKIVPGRVRGYDISNGQIQNARFIDMRIAGGGGALLSTVEDLHKWNIALYSGAVIYKENLQKMTSSQVQIIDSTDYGYGLFIEKKNAEGINRKKYYHTGGGPGVRSINSYYPEDEIEIIMLSNVNDNEVFSKTEESVEHIVFESLDILHGFNSKR